MSDYEEVFSDEDEMLFINDGEPELVVSIRIHLQYLLSTSISSSELS